MKSLPALIIIALYCFTASGQTGSTAEPVRYVGGQTVDPSVHDGRLRYAVGTENIQTMRANRTHPEDADGFGWTYNHASNLCYWNGNFYQHYLSNVEDEQTDPGQTLVMTSIDGRHWTKPKVVFPPYKAPTGVKIPAGYNGYIMHQRMGFYVAPDGRLLVLGFYGHAEDPFEKGGIGRVVREIYKDGSYGPIYFIRYSSQASWNETNTSYPFFKRSTDAGFVTACESLLKDPLMTFQWFEEDKGVDGFYHGRQGQKALSYFHRKDGKVVALWKKSFAALSSDEGKTFSTPVKVPTLLMSGGKQWGQRTDDGKYAIAYNPIEQTQYRFPLAIVSGEDGILYDHLLTVNGELPVRRYSGRYKDFGPCYMRGIEEGNGNPPGTDMWLSYSMNKEDIWIARIPVPITYAVKGAVNDSFDQLQTDGKIPSWNLYSPAWAPVTVVESRGKPGKSMQLSDKDPYDCAHAIRVFQEGSKISLSLQVRGDSLNKGRLEIEVTDQFGNRPVRINFDEQGHILANDGSIQKEVANYQKNKWYKVEVWIEANLHGAYSLLIDGKKIVSQVPLAEAVKSVERLSIRTGRYTDLPNRQTPNETKEPPLPGADVPASQALFFIDDVHIKAN